MPARHSLLPILAALAAGLVACGDARTLQAQPGGGGGVCTSCHGGTDNDTGAPPRDTQGRTDTAQRGVGAHTSHVEAGPVAGAFDCGECHVKPDVPTSPGHNNGTVEVVFGALAGTGTASPVWNGSASPPTCSSVYCHGATLGGGAGTVLAPEWTTVNGTQASCGKCHTLPPAGHLALAAGSNSATCAVCHDQTVLPGGAIDVPGGKHVNGLPEVVAGLPHPTGWVDTGSASFHAYQVNSGGPSGCFTCHAASGTPVVTTVMCSDCHGAGWTTSCTMCHGDANRTGTTGADPNFRAAPPAATWGNQGDPVRAGAHVSHVLGSHNIATPVACNQCHVVPADALSPGHIDQPTATVTWGALATADGASPAPWNRAVPTCSSTYCHGATVTGGTNKIPDWTVVNGTQAACGTCHDAPPDIGRHLTHAGGTSCTLCHGNIANSAGTAIGTGKALHVNGTVDVILANGNTWGGTWDCNSCH